MEAKYKILTYLLAVLLIFGTGFYTGSQFSSNGGMSVLLRGGLNPMVQVIDSVTKTQTFVIQTAYRHGDTIHVPTLIIPITSDSVIANNLHDSVIKDLDSLKNQSIDLVHTEQFITLTADTIDVSYNLAKREFLNPTLRKAPVKYAEITKNIMIPTPQAKTFFESPWVAGTVGFLTGVGAMTILQKN